jgi:hypothetical protein
LNVNKEILDFTKLNIFSLLPRRETLRRVEKLEEYQLSTISTQTKDSSSVLDELGGRKNPLRGHDERHLMEFI